jgi:short subunit dehydrogenase-like uncharacterized protein
MARADLLVWGATGFTGRLVAAAVARSAPEGLLWALGGRDRGRLERFRDELGLDLPLVVADALDAQGMATVAAGARTVVSTVGPYARLGTPLVAACAEAGSDYADITGELLWMRRSIDRFDAAARRSGARIVHAAGFDSVPTDVGVALLQAAALERYGRPCAFVHHTVGPMAGGLGGGTVASALGMADELAADPSLIRAVQDADLLAPGGRPSSSGGSAFWPRRDPLGTWTAPFVMAMVNTRVARRTRALLGEPWGDVTLVERLRVRGPLEAVAWTAPWALAALLALGPARALARRLLPQPGDGPDEASLDRGFFETVMTGVGEGIAAPVVLRLRCDLDPGFRATAAMLAQVGLMLAMGESDAPGGVLTPASLGAASLAARLEAAGLRWSLEA